MRNSVIAAALAAVALVWPTIEADARGGHGGIGGRGGMGGAIGHAAAFHPSGFSAIGPARPLSVGVPHLGPRFALGPRFDGHHRLFRHHHFAVIGGAYPYGYYDDCYRRVWTPWGWRWQYECY